MDKKLCCFSETPVSNYCTDYVPDTESSVIALDGDSGHGFKMATISGNWVTELIAKGKQDETRSQWLTVTEYVSQWGDSVNWKEGQGAEWGELIGRESKVAAKL